ncbi:MAG: peptide deformylase [Chloroflexi bacterium]|nr:peptide deformylase [Chloroflexota bacterium]
MALLPIRMVPDPVLRQPAKRVDPRDPKLDQLIGDMIDTMRAANGVGLAGNQVGVLLQLCVIEVPEEERVRVLLNPRILAQEGERELDEGCLSLPGYRGRVKRSVKVKVRAQDRHGRSIQITAKDNLLAEALEHEIDHLKGTLYLDRLVAPDAIWKLPVASTPEAVPQPSPLSGKMPPAS